ncbi:MAG: methyltransferase family protein [Bacteroidia bacterium]
MPADKLKIILPVYFLIYFTVLALWRVFSVKRKYGVNPFVLPGTDNAYGLIGFYTKLIFLLIALVLIIFVFLPSWYQYLIPISYLQSEMMQETGLTVLAIVFVWILFAQNEMQSSWRIGIDFRHKTKLITTGLFRYSRNPIFLGLIVTMLSLFLVLPNAITLIVFIVSFVLINIQIRLEEDFLRKTFGKDYEDYCKKVRRWC